VKRRLPRAADAWTAYRSYNRQSTSTMPSSSTHLRLWASLPTS